MKLKYRSNNTKNFKTMMIAILAVVTCSMLVGYAALSREIKVNGTANISASSFDVKFETVAVTTGSVTTTAANAAQIKNNNTVEFTVALQKPGDFYEFTVYVKNNGSIAAKIGTVTKTPTTLPKYLEYTATYEDGTEVKANDQLASGASKTIKVRVKYSTNLNPSDLPSTAPASPFILVFALNYVQA